MAKNNGCELNESTKLAIGESLLKKIQETQFCIVGCGGVGSLFAEMLARTGANNISLIDCDRVEHKNLNRTPFLLSDIGSYKVEALKNRLESINKKINIEIINRAFGCYNEKDIDRQEVRDLVANSDITLISVDKNEVRINCEQLLHDVKKEYLVIGVEVNKNISRYACGWMTKTPNNEKNLEGYGENNGSYMSIVAEAVCSGFNLMMHHMENNVSSENQRIERKYENYLPSPLSCTCTCTCTCG